MPRSPGLRSYKTRKGVRSAKVVFDLHLCRKCMLQSSSMKDTLIALAGNKSDLEAWRRVPTGLSCSLQGQKQQFGSLGSLSRGKQSCGKRNGQELCRPDGHPLHGAPVLVSIPVEDSQELLLRGNICEERPKC